MPGMWQQVHQSTDFPYHVGCWYTKEDLSKNPTISFPQNRDEAEELSLYHEMMPYLKEIIKLDGHISPDMRRTIHQVMSVIHEKVCQCGIGKNLAKYGTITVQADRVSTLKQKNYSTFSHMHPKILTTDINT